MLTTNNMVQENAGGNISNEKTVNLLCKTVDNKLSFEPYLNKMCKKVSRIYSMPLQEFQLTFQKRNLE